MKPEPELDRNRFLGAGFIAWAILVILIIWLLGGNAHAAPKARPGECHAFWDVALVARALALTDHAPKETFDVLKLVYDFERADERVRAVVAAIVVAAQRSETKKASEFAAALHNACVYHRGDMDAVLGVES